MFALELMWRGNDLRTTLERMGANLGRTALLDQPWRSVSYAFLHDGLFHLVLSTLALAGLGSIVERVAGPDRFVVTYAVSAAAGGLTSAVLHPTLLAVGASGAIWGLMAWLMVFTVRARRLTPTRAAPTAIRTMVFLLGVNLLLSLAPGVDAAAHVGGALAGTGMILTGWTAPSREQGPLWRLWALAAGIMMVGCIALAFAHGQPWRVR
jgi:rhomboid protease GluP